MKSIRIMMNLGLPFAASMALTACIVVVAQGDERPDLQPVDSQDTGATVSYSKEVEPIFRQHCQGCHQPAKPQGGFVMTEFARLLQPGESGEPAIVEGQPENSYLLEQIAHVDGKAAMPKNQPPLSKADIDLIRSWIAQGSVDDSPPAPDKFSAANPPVYSRPPLITTVAYSPDGRWLAASGFQEVLLIDASTFQTAKRLIGLSERIESVSFSPDSRLLAVTGGSPGRLGEVQVWEVESGELVLSRQITFDTVYGGCFSPDGKLIAFGASDNVVRAIDAQTGEQKLHQGAHDDWIRACVFSPDGKHLVSAGRDMTVKLTEVETERFIDNITSITPGALRGGINSLAMHPSRNEVLVGGSDGSPMVYRLFRETERRIGDDANRIRTFPTMPGRIFSVAISANGKYLAAASTLDGKSQIAIYPYDFDGTLPDNVKSAMAKRLTDRSDEDNKLIAEYTSKTADAVVKLDFDDNRVYAIAFSPDGNRLALGGSDGVLRTIEVASGEVVKELVPVPLSGSDGAAASSQELQAGSGLSAPTGTQPDPTAERELLAQILAGDRLQKLIVEPKRISFSSPRDYAQLIVTGVYAGGQQCDLTRQVKVESSNLVSVSETGLLRPLAAGQGQLTISIGNKKNRLAVTVADCTQPPEVDFIRDVNPILSRLGCNSGTCHGAQKGKNGFKLSLRGYDPLEDIRALSDDLSSRRLNTAAPDASLMLLKPLGLVPHEGGVLLTKDSVYYETLRSWVAADAELNVQTPKVARIELTPQKPVLERENAWQQFRVVAHFPDGTTRDVTHEAFIESGNGEIVKSFEGGRVQALRRGEAPLLARYEGAYASATVTVMGDRQGFAWQTPQANNPVDELVANKWERMKILPSELCSDAEFLRRVCLDLTGLPPTTSVLREFLADQRPTELKRQAKIDQLIGSPEYIDHWTNKWSDLLQVNSKFLGPEGAKDFQQWIRAAVEENRPYDQFARDVLTAAGSNKENPAASYYKILREPDAIMENTTHLFLGIRFNCNKCHDHPFERWTQDQYYEMAAFFARTGLAEDPASGGKKLGGTAVEGAKPLYEMVVDKDAGEMIHVRTGAEVAPEFPFECDYEADKNASRRTQLAAWLTSPDNPYFATSFVNRLWGYLTGTGLMEPLDDIRAGNPPTNPELLEYLSQEFIQSGFDMEHVLRTICNSRTYQLSVATNKWNEDDRINYSHATARRLPAEVLYDAVYRVTGSLSDIPGVAPGTRAAAFPDAAVQLADGFLNNLGRPVRESACECERSHDLQLGPVMALVSGPTVGKAISDPKCALPQLADTEMSDEDLIREIYLRVLSREATEDEVASIASMSDQIVADHRMLQKQLRAREAWWVAEKEQLERRRLEQLEQTRKSIAVREQEFAPELARLEAERVKRLAEAEKALDEYAQGALAIGNKYLSDQTKKSNEWFPLAPASMRATNKANLVALADRSIVASGNADKGTYTISFRTNLRGIRGLRLEALPLPTIPGSGPGLSSNGNFVITELELDAASVAKPKDTMRFLLVKGQADFSQSGFNPAQAVDAQTKDQRGWAVSPRGGTVHWVTYETKTPIDYEGGTILTLTIHQNHNAADHRLAHFRISVTTDEGGVQIGLPEEFAALTTLPNAKRNPETLAPLLAYLEQNDEKWEQLRQSVQQAKQPVPEDEQLASLRRLAATLESETPDDPKLVQLRADAETSREQMKDQRLTLAQDLTWALINSPAFLFNH